MPFDAGEEPRLTKLNRLLLIADALETMPGKNASYSQSYWRNESLDAAGNVCQTTACALGWGMLKYPDAFGELKFDLDSEEREEEEGLVFWERDYFPMDMNRPEVVRDEAFHVIGDELGLTPWEAEDYFGGNGQAYRTEHGDALDGPERPALVAQTIRALHARKTAEVFAR